MCKQRIGLIGQVRKRIIDTHVLDLKAGTGAGLVYPDFFLVYRITIGQCFLKIIDTCTEAEYIIEIEFKADPWINTHRIRTDDSIALAIECYIGIDLCKQ